jgi:1-phosphatidylinositol-3-phosphate 5-kinase
VLLEGVPSFLVKILGVFRIRYNFKGRVVKQDLLVMENLFYGKNITKTFDLKGSLRNRYQDNCENNNNNVLLDENLLESLFYFNISIIS